jgi:hypothetical protein
LSSEISTANGVKINGDMIKGFSSGGDTQQARQNNKDELDFRLQCMMFMFCNSLPDVDPVDTLETLDNFIFKSKFVKQEDMDEIKRLNDENLSFFKLRDDNIKGWCNNDYVLDAFTSIIFDHYKAIRPKMPSVMIADNKIAKGNGNMSIEMACTKLFESTNNQKDIISSDDVLQKVRDYTKNYNINEKKIKETLAALSLGVHGRYTVDRVKFMGYAHIKVRNSAQAVIDGTDDDEEMDS